MPGLKQVDKAAVLAHIRAHQPCSFTSVHAGVLGWVSSHPRKGLIIALRQLEKSGAIKVTTFKHGPHTRRLYEVAP